MKKIVTRALAVALAFTTMVSMSGIMTVNAEAAAKNNVEVTYTGKKTQKAKVSKVTATVDGATKASKKVTVYLSGNKKVKVDTAVKVTVKGQKANKKQKAKLATVTYSSSNTKVATINKKGVITAKKAGKTVITVKSKANTKKAYKITLTVKPGVKSMKLNSDKNIEMKEGTEVSFAPTVKTYKKVKKTITAKTSDKKVAKVAVDKKGKVTITAVAPGTADVTVAPKFGSDKAQVIKVTVKAKEYKTKVVFADPTAKKVTLTGTLSWKDQKDLAKAVEEFAAALKGDYTVKVNGKEAKVVKGVVDKADLAKIPASGEKKDATIEASITIADALKLAGDVDAKATVEFKGEFTIGGVKVSGISLANKVVSFKLGDAAMKAFVEGGDLYLDGDQSKLLEVYKDIYGANKSVVKEFVVVEK